MSIKKLQKDPQAKLDYLMDFKAKTNNRPGALSDYLETSESIISATVTSSKPLELIVSSVSLITNSTTVLFWLEGGVSGKEYTVTVSIVTSMGREDDRSVKIQVVNK
jgi:ABC-type Zn2+ transport system substrate-binding protein/surface adhesin